MYWAFLLTRILRIVMNATMRTILLILYDHLNIGIFIFFIYLNTYIHIFWANSSWNQIKHKINFVFDFLSFKLSLTFNFTIHLITEDLLVHVRSCRILTDAACLLFGKQIEVDSFSQNKSAFGLSPTFSFYFSLLKILNSCKWQSTKTTEDCKHLFMLKVSLNVLNYLFWM